MSNARASDKALASFEPLAALNQAFQRVVKRVEDLEKENRRLKGRLRSVSAARSRLRRKMARS